MDRAKAEGRKQVGALLDVELYRRMRAAAALQGRTVSEVLEDAMRQYLECAESRKTR